MLSFLQEATDGLQHFWVTFPVGLEHPSRIEGTGDDGRGNTQSPRDCLGLQIVFSVKI